MEIFTNLRTTSDRCLRGNRKRTLNRQATLRSDAAANRKTTRNDCVTSRIHSKDRLVGDIIIKVNVVAHTATARNGDFDVAMPPKKTVTYVLKKPGTVEYYCRFHPNMKAVLNVAP